jgi:hypothetical protein
MDLESDESVRAELRRLSPSGDLVAMAGDMRRRGVDSLLVCRPDGRIARVVTEHRLRRLAQPEPQQHLSRQISTGGTFMPEQIRSSASVATDLAVIRK